MSEQERLSYLLKRYAANQCSAEQFEELFSLIKQSGDQPEMLKGLKDVWESTNSEPAKSDEEWQRLYTSISAKQSNTHGSKTTYWKAIAVAASLILIATITLLLFKTQQPDQEKPTAKVKPTVELAPGGNKAVLTLANGKKIILDGKNSGVIASQTGMTISKTSNGQLVYSLPAAADNIAADAYNTIQVPKGGQYQVAMADGTRVWLNAMSSLRFPLNFKNNEREVELEGEGYFEVAKKTNAPFRVQTKNQTVEVLGTHFNINAYQNEKAVRTTLLEGAVKVNSIGANKSVTLSPGQQSSLMANTLAVKEIDTELVVAWKNGSFMFNNDKLEDIMRQIARWYDVEVVYSNEKVKDRLLSGTISRFENASQVFDVLELTGLIHFKIEGRRVMVM